MDEVPLELPLPLYRPIATPGGSFRQHVIGPDGRLHLQLTVVADGLAQREPATATKYMRIILRFVTWCEYMAPGGYPLAEAPKLVASFLREEFGCRLRLIGPETWHVTPTRHASSTIRVVISALIKYLDILIEYGVLELPRNPLRQSADSRTRGGIGRFVVKGQPWKPHYHHEPDLPKLMILGANTDSWPHWACLLCAILFESGARVGDAIDLRLGDWLVSNCGNILSAPSKSSAGRRVKQLVIRPETAAELAAYCDGERAQRTGTTLAQLRQAARSSRVALAAPLFVGRFGNMPQPGSPLDGREYGLGRDKPAAFAQAIEANLHVAGLLSRERLLDRVIAGGEQTVVAWCGRYEQILADRPLADETRKEVARRLVRVKADLGQLVLPRVTTRDIADFLLPWTEAGKKRMGQAMRSLLLDLFREAVAAGWTDRNPVEPTRAPRIVVERARLTLEDFRKIHACAVEHEALWVARSMELALVTGQRREDLAALGRKDVRDGRLWVVQQKTGARVCIPLDLRLQAVNWSVSEVIQRCQDKILAKTFIHHAAFAGRAKPGDKVRLHSITAAFAEARDKAGVTVPDGKTPPTFHEIRSLASRLYNKQGIDDQALLGHKSGMMTAAYRDVRGAEWVEVAL